MGIFSGTPPPSCPSAPHCAEWAKVYLKYCLCSTKDGVALGLGLASVLSWGIAEVPQIITNYKQKSTEGLSIAFLMTWIVGDLFNLVGCFLEPATLPTQFYMALLYTITTVILTGQTIYYSHIYHLKVKKTGVTAKSQKHQRGDASLREKLLGHRDEAFKNNIQSGPTIPIPSSPIQVSKISIEEPGAYRFISEPWQCKWNWKLSWLGHGGYLYGRTTSPDLLKYAKRPCRGKFISIFINNFFYCRRHFHFSHLSPFFAFLVA
ncbi:hypothetical protein TRIUR3_23354 [Triticum urartu]|uniref:Uncharacterized protein n=2 Tax=Triticum TaxID=4564 RepID=A0A9R0VKQ8_TRITD|nr:hypothetical protein TRIUR3_23354 [Triticum urartu]VAH60074.1 unnamed protein product [Triticum turgidum subsp. durum]